jgi:hypothetical protein
VVCSLPDDYSLCLTIDDSRFEWPTGDRLLNRVGDSHREDGAAWLARDTRSVSSICKPGAKI